MAETFTAKLPRNRTLEVPVLAREGDWVLHRNIKKDGTLSPTYYFSVSHAPSGRALLYIAEEWRCRDILFMIKEMGADGQDPTEPRLIYAAKLAQMGKLAPRDLWGPLPAKGTKMPATVAFLF